MLSLDDAKANTGPAVERWRLLVDFDAPGPFNMAVDEALLESVIAGAPPVVRFYTWRPATLSLGTNQAISEIDRRACAERRFDVVRRLTGGRAVLHQHELTYSVVARENDPRVSGGVIESYRKISVALVEGLRSLGVDVSLAEPNPRLLRSLAPIHEPVSLDDADTGRGVCFDAATAYELTANGKKLVGSAQARRGGALLQHGSILLDIDWDAWVSVFAYATRTGKQRAYNRLPSRMTSLRHELSRPVSPREAMDALVPAFESALSVSLAKSGLDEQEMAEAQRLASEKYGSEAWTARK
jgi:lipoyl(octanoyl) transferase